MADVGKVMRRAGRVAATLVLVLASDPAPPVRAHDAPRPAPDRAAAVRIARNLPLFFVENAGQFERHVSFAAVGSKASAFIAPTSMTFALRGDAPRDRATVALELMGARRDAKPEGADPLPTLVSYFRGPRDQWHAGLRAWSSVVTRDAWPGIDFVANGAPDNIEYGFVVHSGADPGRIRVRHRGASSVAIENGALAVATAAGSLRNEPPRAYQVVDGRRVDVPCAFALGRRGRDAVLQFELGAYDRRRELVIDPVVLLHCGYIGGVNADSCSAIALDAAGNAYVTGYTASDQLSFPVNAGPDLTFANGGLPPYVDAFVAKVRADGTALDYAGYIGGDGADGAESIAVDALGRAIVVGYTASTESTFPVAVGPDLTYNGGSFDGFVARVSADGTSLEYAGYIGGSAGDTAGDVAVDASGAAFTCGPTTSTELTFPVSVGPDLTYNGGAYGDAFVAKVRADGSGLEYAGYIGGAGDDNALGIDLAGSGAVVVVGATTSDEASFPVRGGPDLTYDGTTDAFVAKIRPDGTGLEYAGYIGGTEPDLAWSVAVDPGGVAHVGGRTDSTEASFPVALGPDLTHNGGLDGFVACVAPDGSRLLRAGYMGGSGTDAITGIGLDATGNEIVAGFTDSTETTFPIKLSSSTYGGGWSDAFVARIRADGTDLDYSVFIGGTSDDVAWDVAVDAEGDARVAGRTLSDEASFPVIAGPGMTWNGDEDGFVAEVHLDLSCNPAILVPPTFLRGSKDGIGARFEWLGDPAAVEYHLNTVATTAALHETDPTSVHAFPRGQGELQCSTTGLTCTDADALVDPRPLLFYQVFSACGPTGADEGPMCPASDPCP